MGKLIGLLLTIVCLWAALEVYNEGVHGAFDGALASFSDEPADTPRTPQSVPKRAGAAVEKAHAAADDRRSRLLGE